MLVLCRKVNQDISIGTGADTITVRLLRISKNEVRLGIAAPAHVQIDRSEVREQKDTKLTNQTLNTSEDMS